MSYTDMVYLIENQYSNASLSLGLKSTETTKSECASVGKKGVYKVLSVGGTNSCD